jgi:hypothetical protein
VVSDRNQVSWIVLRHRKSRAESGLAERQRYHAPAGGAATRRARASACRAIYPNTRPAPRGRYWIDSIYPFTFRRFRLPNLERKPWD